MEVNVVDKTISEKDELVELALNVLYIIELREGKYDEVNASIRKLIPEFTPYLTPMDSQIENMVVKLLDHILGDDIASYYLYEAKDLEEGGAIFINKHKYQIKDMADVVKFVYKGVVK